MIDTVMLYSGWLLFVAVFLAVVPTIVVTMRWMLPTAADGEFSHGPTLSVIVAAKNEEANIDSAIRSLLLSDYGHYKVIAVNDRSTDQTGNILDSIANEDSRLTVLHITSLPEDWLGKNHAMHQAAQAADSEFLLFTDGDVKFAPSALRTAMKYVDQNQLDHLCVFPQMTQGGFVENCLVTFFGMCFCIGLQSWLVPTAFKFSYVGVGAFNLVRRSAYEAMGGHEALKFEVLDDVKLGKLMKRNGAKQDLVRTDDLVSVRWQPSAWGVITGLEKNGFASLNYSVFKLLMTTLVFFVGFVGPYVVIACCPDVRSGGFIATVLTWHIMFGYMGHCLGSGWAVLPFFPFAAFGMACAFWRSSWITLRQRGVRWRDTFYTLETLRERLVR